MKRTKCGGGSIYSIPMTDIEYVGYFLANSKAETVKQAYKRITKLRGSAPTFLFNAELFDFKTRAAVSDVVRGGVVDKLSENYGIAFPNNKSAVFCYKNNVGAKDYVGAYPVLIKGGKIQTSEPSGIGGSRGRTAIGVGNGNFIMALIPDGGNDVTLSILRSAMKAAGATDAINLDGGGSTQYYCPSDNYLSVRPVRGFIGVWLNKGYTLILNEKEDIRTVKVKTNLRIRSTPSLLGVVKGRLYNGDTVKVLETKNGWCKIASGWVSAKYLVKN